MALLAGVNYDPGTAVTKATSSLLAMTAIDTTNLRLTFTAPANGSVQVRIGATVHGATTMPQILLGVLSGATVVGRQAAWCGQMSNVATNRTCLEAIFTVKGLSGSQTWDAAYAVQVIIASTGIKYGGPNNTTTDDAWGGFVFEVWETPNLLASTLYDPTTAVSKATTALLAMTAIDTTNLRLTFTAPASGNVLVRMRGVIHGAASIAQILLGCLESSTVVGRIAPHPGKNYPTTQLATTFIPNDAQFLVTGVSGGSHTYDAAYGVEVAIASSGLKYGGPDNNSGANAQGGFAFEVWAA